MVNGEAPIVAAAEAPTGLYPVNPLITLPVPVAVLETALVLPLRTLPLTMLLLEFPWIATPKELALETTFAADTRLEIFKLKPTPVFPVASTFEMVI